MDEYPHIDHVPRTETEWFGAVCALARYLRTPEGCPWDRKQTALSFSHFLREEASEYIDACEVDDAENMAEEWGDTLFVLLASLAAAEEAGAFTLEQALRGIHEKMIRRHAHVFGDAEVATPDEVAAHWEQAKAREKGSPGPRGDSA